MSYEVWGEPDDAPELPDGCIDPDDAETLRDLFKHVLIETRSGNKSDAALVLIEHLLFHVPTYPRRPDDPTVIWARALLGDSL